MDIISLLNYPALKEELPDSPLLLTQSTTETLDTFKRFLEGGIPNLFHSGASDMGCMPHTYRDSTGVCHMVALQEGVPYYIVSQNEKSLNSLISV